MQESIIGGQRQGAMPCTCTGDRCTGKLSCLTRCNRRLEEGPHVCTFSGAGDFDICRDFELSAGGCVSHRVFTPARSIEIGSHKPTGIIEQDRIDAECSTTGEVFIDGLVRDGEESAVGAVDAFDSWLLTDTSYPLIGAGWGVSHKRESRESDVAPLGESPPRLSGTAQVDFADELLSAQGP